MLTQFVFFCVHINLRLDGLDMFAQWSQTTRWWNCCSSPTQLEMTGNAHAPYRCLYVQNGSLTRGQLLGSTPTSIRCTNAHAKWAEMFTNCKVMPDSEWRWMKTKRERERQLFQNIQESSESSEQSSRRRPPGWVSVRLVQVLKATWCHNWSHVGRSCHGEATIDNLWKHPKRFGMKNWVWYKLSISSGSIEYHPISILSVDFWWTLSVDVRWKQYLHHAFPSFGSAVGYRKLDGFVMTCRDIKL